MPIYIDGEKFLVNDLRGTDLHVLHQFISKNKLNGALFIYQTDNEELAVTHLSKNKDGERMITTVLDIIRRSGTKIN